MESLELRKKLIQHINSSDEKALQDLYDFAMLKAIKESDPFDELPPLAQKLLLKSSANAEKGNVRPHEEVMAEIKKRYSNTN